MRRIAIVGAGLGGLCAAIKAREAGHQVSIFESADEVGGTWRANRYPGVACDVPAILYQFSFAPNHEWSHFYARGKEIHDYTKSLVDQFGLSDALRLGEGVRRADWDDGANCWVVESQKGSVERFDALVPALGQLSRPIRPHIEGMGSFAGQSWHSAEWPEGVSLSGKRVGVIGSAASAVQIIPEIADEVTELVVFQRTPNWCIPRADVAVPNEVKALFATNPDMAMKLGASQRQQLFDQADTFFWQAFEWTPEGRAAYTRIALDHLESQIADPELRSKLVPDYPIGCKRVLITDDFYPALTRENVTLETDPIVEIVASGVSTGSKTHELDLLVFATGFETTDWNWSMEVVGKDGESLADAWSGGPEAYLGIMVSGFPNMFVLYGPNTNLGHNSITNMLESQVGYMLRVLGELDAKSLSAADVTAEAQKAYNDRLQGELEKTVWADPNCNSWYKTDQGRISQNWGGNCADYANATASVDIAAVAMS